MSLLVIQPEPLTPEAFAPFGDVLQVEGATAFEINDGFTTRVHDLCSLQFRGTNAHPIVSFFLGRPRPLTIRMVECHPYGSQAFMPLDPHPWLVVVATSPRADRVRAFWARGDQGVNYHAGVWHHPLLVTQPQRFLVIDRHGQEPNCEEMFFEPGTGVDLQWPLSS
ncbi:MAG: ureidoglycolate lyase [Litorivicinaceae bacterium]